MTKISPRHAAARRIAGSYPNPLDLTRPEPCAPETAASLRTAYDAAWDAANAAWDELPGDEPAPAHEEALIAELDAILAREDAGVVMSESTAVAILEAAPLEFSDSPPLVLDRRAAPLDPATHDEGSDAFSNLRHIPEATRTSLAMVLDAAPRRAPRHVHRAPVREQAATPAPKAARPPRRKRRPVLGTVAIAVVLLGGVAAAVFFLDESGTPIGAQTAGTDIPWIRAQTGVPNSLLARPTAAAPVTDTAVPAPTLQAGAAAPAALPEKADERVPATEAVPPLTNDVRVVTTQPVTTGAEAATPPAAGPDAAPQVGVTATTWVNMRGGPGADEAVVAVVEPGAQVEVIACENWCEVVVNGQRGFIYNEYLAGLR